MRGPHQLEHLLEDPIPPFNTKAALRSQHLLAGMELPVAEPEAVLASQQEYDKLKAFGGTPAAESCFRWAASVSRLGP